MKNLIAHEDKRLLSATASSGAKAQSPADAKKIYDLLFDDVENEPITSIGIAEDNPDYVRLCAFLGERAKAELRSVISRTREARKILSSPLSVVGSTNESSQKRSDSAGEWTMAEYSDGLKLRKTLAFNKDCVAKHFPSVAVPTDLQAAGEALAKEVAGARAEARQRIWALIKPHVPKWALGTVLLMVSESAWGVLHAYTMSMPHMLTEVIDGGTTGRAAKHCLMVGMAYLLNFPVDTLGDVLVDDVEAEVQLKLRASVMATVLAQDRAYFDAHQVGA